MPLLYKNKQTYLPRSFEIYSLGLVLPLPLHKNGSRSYGFSNYCQVIQDPLVNVQYFKSHVIVKL